MYLSLPTSRSLSSSSNGCTRKDVHIAKRRCDGTWRPSFFNMTTAAWLFVAYSRCWFGLFGGDCCSATCALLSKKPWPIKVQLAAGCDTTSPVFGYSQGRRAKRDTSKTSKKQGAISARNGRRVVRVTCV